MSFIIIDGNTYEVQTQGARETYITPGESKRTEIGNLRSTLLTGGTKRRWDFVSGPISEATYQVLRALHGTQKVCDGDMLNNVSATCQITIGNGAFVDDGNLGHFRIATIRLDEV